VLLATSLITGIFSVVPQVMAPMASALSKTEAQGRAVGIVLGGMLIGILACAHSGWLRRHLVRLARDVSRCRGDDGRHGGTAASDIAGQPSRCANPI
jgi:hypothetical protein